MATTDRQRCRCRRLAQRVLSSDCAIPFRIAPAVPLQTYRFRRPAEPPGQFGPRGLHSPGGERGLSLLEAGQCPVEIRSSARPYAPLAIATRARVR